MTCHLTLAILASVLSLSMIWVAFVIGLLWIYGLLRSARYGKAAIIGIVVLVGLVVMGVAIDHEIAMLKTWVRAA